MPAKHKQSIIIANDLRTGLSVYLTRDSRWSDSVSDAEVLSDTDYAETRLQAAVGDERCNLVIDPYLIGIESDLSAVDIREQIRVSGPTIFTDAHVAVTQAA